MAIKTSTGLRNHALATGSVKNALDNGFLKIYGTAAAPATADAAVPGGAVLLVTISNNSTGTGITLDSAAAAGIIAKNSGEVWSGVNAATGTALWFRQVAAGDDGTESTTQPRIQGSIATAGADMNISNTTLTSGATHTVNNYNFAWPTL